MKLKDKIVLLTGAAGDMGVVASRRFCEEGAIVIGTDLDAEAGATLENDLRKLGHNFTFIASDVTSAANIRTLAEEIRTQFGRIDVLYNNAGVVLGKHVLETTEAEWDLVHSVIAKGTFLMTREIAPLMPPGSSIVNIASGGGVVGLAHMSAYCSAKAAVILFTKATAIDLAPHIRVNAICPGTIDTKMPRSFTSNLSKEDAAAVMAGLASGALLNRLGEPEEVVNVGLFLASDDSSFMTGAEIIVDGGYIAK